MAINIYLVEDDLRFSKLLLGLLETNPTFNVMGHATSLEQARQFFFHNEPDVIIIDLSLPDGSGIDLMAQAQQLQKKTKILAISNIGDEKHILGSINAGASGFLLKSEPPDAFERSIISVATHGGYLSPHASKLVVSEMKLIRGQIGANNSDAKPISSDNSSHYISHETKLTPKEKQVIPLLAAGMSAKLIADQLSVSPFTINQHLRSIYRKLKVQNKVHAIIKARELGLLLI